MRYPGSTRNAHSRTGPISTMEKPHWNRNRRTRGRMDSGTAATAVAPTVDSGLMSTSEEDSASAQITPTAGTPPAATKGSASGMMMASNAVVEPTAEISAPHTHSANA